MFLAQRGNHQDPSGEIQGIWLHFPLVLARLALGTSFGLLLLFLTQAKSDQTQLDPFVDIGYPNRTARGPSLEYVESFEPIYHRDWRSLLIFHGELGWADANDDVGKLRENKGDAFAQAIGPIGDHQISLLQIKDLEMLSL